MSRLLTGMLVLSLALAACGGPEEYDEDGLTNTDDALSTGSWAAVRRDTRKCAAPACGGYFLAPVQRATLKCPDGASRASCYVATLDLSALGLAANALDGSIPAAGAGGEKLLVRGVSAKSNGGTFRVSEAHRAAKAAPAGATFYVVRTSGAVTYAKINTSSKRTAQAFAIATTAGTAAARAQATAEAATADGLVASGTASTSGGRTTFTASGIFLRVAPVPATPNACGATEKQAFEQATAGLLYTSESDYPFTVALRPDLGGAVPDEATVRTLAGSTLPAGAAIRPQTIDAFFQWIGRPDDPSMDPGERATVARYRALRTLLEHDLTDLRVFRAGEIQVQVYVLGRTACGELVALSTVSIET